MNAAQIQTIKENLGINLSAEQVLKFKKWQKLFIEYNSHTNLMSRNEVGNLFEKHLYDCLSIVLWEGFLKAANGGKLLDIGTGGGFPSVILAVAFPSLSVTANDSRSRKTNFIELAKKELGLENLEVICGRAEDLPPQNADIVTFRAVGKIKGTLPLACKHLKNGGYSVFYKAVGAEDETNEALDAYNKSTRRTSDCPNDCPGGGRDAKSFKIVPYKLPIDIEHTRNLVVVGGLEY